MPVYIKICTYCGKEYTSESRNQRYCCQECCDKAQKRKTKVDKAREVRRRKYNQTREWQLLISRAYDLAHRMAFNFLKKEDICGGDEAIEGPLELHHKDGNIFNNNLENLVWLTKSRHARLHTKLPKFNWVDILVEASERKVSPTVVFEEKRNGVDIRAITEALIEKETKENAEKRSGQGPVADVPECKDQED